MADYTTIIRKRGVIVIPLTLRKLYDMKEGDAVRVTVVKEKPTL